MKSFGPKIMNSSRNSAIELLRIIAMFLIVLSHACCHSSFDIASSSISFNKLLVQWGFLGNIGVNIFVLISGYYLCTKSKTGKSLIQLILQVWFYSVVLFVICKFVFQYRYSFMDYFKVFLPTIFGEYWFFSAYFILSLLSPYLNCFLNRADRNTIKYLICIMVVLWIVIPTFTFQSMYGNDLTRMVLFYVIGAYFKLYPDSLSLKKSVPICLTAFSFFLLFASTLALDYVGQYVDILKNRGTLFYGKSSLLTAACAIGLFVCFIQLPCFTNRIINTISSCTFGIYLIHDNPAIREIVWIRILRLADDFGSKYLFAHMITAVLIVFVVSGLIEFVRICTLGRFFGMLSVHIEKMIRFPDRNRPAST